jgi:hypothetical protein
MAAWQTPDEIAHKAGMAAVKLNPSAIDEWRSALPKLLKASAKNFDIVKGDLNLLSSAPTEYKAKMTLSGAGKCEVVGFEDSAYQCYFYLGSVSLGLARQAYEEVVNLVQRATNGTIEPGYPPLTGPESEHRFVLVIPPTPLSTYGAVRVQMNWELAPPTSVEHSQTARIQRWNREG